MTLSVKHHKVSPKADGSDATQVLPSDWNAVHDLTTDFATGMVLGKSSVGPGSIEELPLAYDGANNWVFNSTGTLLVPRGTTAQRPTTPVSGMLRYNLTTHLLEGYDLQGTGSGWQPVGVPSGTLASFPLAPPAGWFACNGQAISRVSNPNLFTYIGVTFGAGDGSTTFNVPNYADRVLVMIGATYTLGAQRGLFNYNLSLAANQLPAHTHTMGVAIADLGGGAGGAGDVLQNVGPPAVTGGGDGLVGNPFTINTEQPGVGVNIAIRGG